MRLDLANYLPYLVNRVGVAIVEGFGCGAAQAAGAHDLHVAGARRVGRRGGATPGGPLGDDLDRPTNGFTARDPARRHEARHTHPIRHEQPRGGGGADVKGAATVRRLIPSALGWEDRATVGMSAREVAAVKRSLARMYENLTSRELVAREGFGLAHEPSRFGDAHRAAHRSRGAHPDPRPSCPGCRCRSH